MEPSPLLPAAKSAAHALESASRTMWHLAEEASIVGDKVQAIALRGLASSLAAKAAELQKAIQETT